MSSSHAPGAAFPPAPDPDLAGRRRRRTRAAVGVSTGLATVATLGATGWVAGLAADAHAGELTAQRLEQRRSATEYRQELAEHRAAVRAQRRTEASRPRIVYRDRPTRTRVTVRYVAGSTSPGVAPGPGGAVSSSGGSWGGYVAPAPSLSAAGSSGTSAPAAAPQPAAPQPAAPPPPPPAPAPSSGS